MKKFIGLLLSLALVGSSFAQMSGYGSSQYQDLSIGHNPNIARNGIALANAFTLSGHAHVGFYTSDIEGPSSNSMTDLFTKEAGFWAYADLDSQFNFDPVSLNIHTNLADAIFVEQLYLTFNVVDSFTIDAGKFLSHRTLRGEEINERFLRTEAYFNSSMGYLGSTFSNGINQGFTDYLTNLTTGFLEAIDSTLTNEFSRAADADYQDLTNDLLETLGPLYEAFGIDSEEFNDFSDALTRGDISGVSTLLSDISAQMQEATAKMIADMSLIRANYRSSYNKGIRGNFDVGMFNFSAALTESLWNTMPDMGDSNVALDFQAVAYIHPTFAIKAGYAFEKADKVGGLVGLIIPNSDDNIHQFHIGTELALGDFTGIFEIGDTTINPYDTDIWDIAFTLHYQFTEMFGLGMLYSHEDLNTPFGDGDSNLFNLALNFNFSENLLFGVDYTTAESEVGGQKTDYDMLSANTIYSF
jgi:hypothetical protein